MRAKKTPEIHRALNSQITIPGSVLAVHKATEAYLIHLLEDTNLCVMHTSTSPSYQKICSWSAESRVKLSNRSVVLTIITMYILFQSVVTTL